jgi:hypothetical protein
MVDSNIRRDTGCAVIILFTSRKIPGLHSEYAAAVYLPFDAYNADTDSVAK